MKNFFLSVLGFTALGSQAAFPDIQNYDWAESIDYLAESQVINGYPDGSYKPDKSINRAEFTKIVIGSLYDPSEWQNINKDCFPDVDAGAWFAPYICLAKEEGIINGYPDGTFKPAQAVNQAETLKILYESFFEGIEDVDGNWYQKYLDAAEYDGMLYFTPENPGAHQISRGEMAYFTAWMLDEDGLLSDEISYEYFYGNDYEDTDFGWDTMTPDDCFPDEYFDEQDQVCYVIEDEIDYDNETAFYSDEELLGQSYGHDHDPNQAQDHVLYKIEGNDIKFVADNADGNLELADTNKHQLVWERFKDLIPQSNRTYFSEFLVFHDANDDTAAFVVDAGEDLTQWQIGVNIADTFNEAGLIFDNKEFDLTLIHEFAHVMTLNASQVDPSIYEDECRPQFHTGEGCAKQNAFINLFVKKFWNRNMLSKLENNSSTIYDENPEKFVTEYAATNPGEDIAETFAYFVVKPKPNTCEGPQAIQKICFFYEFPGLLTLRKNIREKLR